MSKPVRTVLALLLSSACLTTEAAAKPKHDPEAFHRERDAVMAHLETAGLTASNCTLRGDYIYGKSVKVELAPYPKDGFPHAWDLSTQATSEISEFSQDMENVQFSNGALSFEVTAPGAYVGWGNFNLANKPIKLGIDPINQNTKGRLFAVRVRLRQSLPESEWKIATKTVENKRGKTRDLIVFSDPVTAKGTEWQTLVFRAPRTKGFFCSGLRVVTDTPGNRVEISEVQPLVREQRPAYRKAFELPARVRWAKCSIAAPEYFKIYVNGRLAVHSPPARIYGYSLWNYELDPRLFAEGKNAIAVESAGGRMLFDAAVLCADGTYTRLDSDETWTVNARPETDTWRQPQFDDSGWEQATFLFKHPYYKWQRPVKRMYNKSFFNPSWKGRLAVLPADGRRQPIYALGETVSLEVSAPRRKGESPAFLYEVVDETGDGFTPADRSVTQGVLSPAPRDRDDVAVLTLQADALRKNTSYALILRLMDADRELEAYRYEFVVCGPLDQPVVHPIADYTNGMKLRLVCDIDAAAEPETGEFISCDGNGKPVPSPVIETPLGRFRQTCTNGNVGGDTGEGCSLISWKYRIENRGRPHVAIAEYPDDTVRSQSMLITDAKPETPIHWYGYFSSHVANDTAMLGLENPLTHEIRQHHAIFFPSRKLGAVSIFSIGGKKGVWSVDKAARVGRIRIYEILNDVPAARINEPTGSRRWLGQQMEPGPRVVMQSCFSSPASAYIRGLLPLSERPYFYRSWLTTYINQIKRMRFSGENCCVYGVYMYGGVLYPSRYSYKTAFGRNYAGSLRDSMVLMAKLYEQNNLGLFAGLEMLGIPEMRLQVTDAEMAAGAETRAQVDRHGHQVMCAVGREGTITPNWLHPEAHAHLSHIVTELLDTLGTQPAFKGLVFYVYPQGWGPCWVVKTDDPYYAGYGDITIKRFEQETGLHIPVPTDDPQRFTKRYDWLQREALSEWTQWRADKMSELYAGLRDQLVARRRDLKLVFRLLSQPETEPPIEAQPGKDTDPVFSPLDYAKPSGIDLNFLKKDPDIILAKGVMCNKAIKAYLHGNDLGDWRARAQSPAHTSAYANDGHSGAGVRYYWSEAQIHVTPDWPWKYSGVESWEVPGGEFFADYFANVFIRMNPSLMFFGIIDCALWNGRETDMARFAQAYRSLPNGFYTRLTGNGLDRNLWVELCRYGNDLYGYAANAQCWELNVALSFAQGTRAVDLIDNRPITKTPWTFSLGPYRIRTFRVPGTTQFDVVTAAETRVADKGINFVRGRIERLEQETSRYAAALERGGTLASAQDLIRVSRAAFQQGDYSAARDALATSPVQNVLTRLHWTPSPDHVCRTLVVPRAVEPIQVNGSPDKWESIPLIQIKSKNDVRTSSKDKTWFGPEDLSGAFFCTWDDHSLYFSIRIRDDKAYPLLNSGDSVEVYLDTELHADFGDGKYSPDDFNVKIAKPLMDDDETVVSCLCGTDAGRKIPVPTPGIQAAHTSFGDGHWLEFAVPWKTLNVTAPREGLELGFDVMLIDKDGTGKGHLQVMTWSSPKAQCFADPRLMGRLVLGGKDVPGRDTDDSREQVRRFLDAGKMSEAYALLADKNADEGRRGNVLRALFSLERRRDGGYKRFIEGTRNAFGEGKSGAYARSLRMRVYQAILPELEEQAREEALQLAQNTSLGASGRFFRPPAFMCLAAMEKGRENIEGAIDYLLQAAAASYCSQSHPFTQIGVILEDKEDLKGALGCYVLAWSTAKDRDILGLPYRNTVAPVLNCLNELGLPEKGAEWQAWTKRQAEAPEAFPLYDLYVFPKSLVDGLSKALSEIRRESPDDLRLYGEALYNIGAFNSAQTVLAKALAADQSRRHKENVDVLTRKVQHWAERMPEDLVVPLGKDTKRKGNP